MNSLKKINDLVRLKTSKCTIHTFSRVESVSGMRL